MKFSSNFFSVWVLFQFANFTIFRVNIFVSKSQCHSVCLVMDAGSNPEFAPTGIPNLGYECPTVDKEMPQGIKSWPAVFSYPDVCNLSLSKNCFARKNLQTIELLFFFLFFSLIFYLFLRLHLLIGPT